MVPGINSDVRYAGMVYHVQTEDFGVPRALIRSQVYQGGQVLDTVDSLYDDLPEHPAAEISRRLVSQHREVIRGIMKGRYGPHAAGESGAVDLPDLVVSELTEPCAGERVSLMILFRGRSSYRPIPGARIAIFFRDGVAGETRVHEGATDSRGFHLAEFQVPPAAYPEAALLLRAFSGHGDAEATLPVSDPLASGPLRVDAPKERPGLVVSELEEPRAGSRASFLILLRSESDGRPIPHTQVLVLFPAGAATAETLYEGLTDARGFHLAEFSIPRTDDPNSALLIQATCRTDVAEVVIPLMID
jgi:hypothetical protein